jgi:predicted DNA-binding transcriptional regulator AlpA
MASSAAVERWLDADHVARRLCVSKTTVWNWTREGRLPAPTYITPRNPRWDVFAVDAAIAGQPAAGAHSVAPPATPALPDDPDKIAQDLAHELAQRRPRRSPRR